MKKLFLTACIAFAFLSLFSQENKVNTDTRIKIDQQIQSISEGSFARQQSILQNQNLFIPYSTKEREPVKGEKARTDIPVGSDPFYITVEDGNPRQCAMLTGATSVPSYYGVGVFVDSDPFEGVDIDLEDMYLVGYADGIYVYEIFFTLSKISSYPSGTYLVEIVTGLFNSSYSAIGGSYNDNVHLTLGGSTPPPPGDREATIYLLDEGESFVIDGEKDALWNEQELNYIDQDYRAETPTLSSATWRAAWDLEAIYVLIEVSEDDWQPSWISELADWQSDKPELYFDVNEVLDDGGSPASGNGHYQVAPNFSETDQGTVHTGENGTYYADTWNDSPVSYIYEYAIPFDGLVDQYDNILDPLDRTTIGFDVTIIDLDTDMSGTRQRSVWNNTGEVDECWNNMDDAGIMEFSTEGSGDFINANFTASPPSGTVPLTVSFSDLSSGEVTSWSWNFGDGGTSSMQNPDHTYDETGTYTVSLTVNGPAGSDTKTKSGYIEVLPDDDPEVDAVIKKLNGNGILDIDGEVDSQWDAVEAHDIDLYYQAEVPTLYDATWKAVWDNQAIYVLVEVSEDQFYPSWLSGLYSWESDKPEVYFDVNEVLDDGGGPASGLGHYQVAPDFSQTDQGTVHFGDNETYYADTWDMSPASYIYEYAVPFSGLIDIDGYTYNPNARPNIGFDVCIIDLDEDMIGARQRAVWMNQGNVDEDWNNMDDAGIIKLSTEYLNEPTEADFTASVTTGTAPLLVNFTDLSTGDIIAWTWNFGDGGTSGLQSPNYIFSTPGTYNVMLTVTDGSDVDTETKSGYITVTPSTTASETFSANKPKLSVRPNPVTDVSQITFRLENESKINLMVYDMTGTQRAVIYSGHCQSGDASFNLDASKLPAGNYYVQLTSENLILNQKVVVIQ